MTVAFRNPPIDRPLWENPFAGIRQYTWQHPEWWALGLSLGAWVAMFAPGFLPFADLHAAHMHAEMLGTTAFLRPPERVVSWSQGLFLWIDMVVCMMFPLIVVPIRTTANRSLWKRRHRAVMEFLVGYMIPWLALGLGASALSSAIRVERWAVATRTLAAVCVVIIAVVWQFTPIKRAALAGCDRTVPLAPTGWPAHRDSIGYGLLVGCNCVLTCWAFMLVPIVSSHNVLTMAVVSSITLAERYVLRDLRIRAFVPIIRYGNIRE